jgi:LPXTG-motif cell wall-anchored protein
MNVRLHTVFLGLGIAAFTCWTTPARADEWNKKTTFTFSEPVEVPGHVLNPGKYVFELADLTADRNVVQVFSEDKTGLDHLITTAMAIPDYRLDTPEKPTVTFEERRSNSPEAIHSWFYPGDNYGWEFLYPKTQRLQVAANTTPAPTPPAVAAAPAPKPAVTAPPARPAAVIPPAPRPTPQPVQTAQNQPPAKQAPPQPAAPPQKLPKTASNLPLAGILGSLMAAAGLGILLGRRRATA